MYKAISSTGELCNGKNKGFGQGSFYSSPSAARVAIKKYKGEEIFEVVSTRKVKINLTKTEVTDALPA